MLYGCCTSCCTRFLTIGETVRRIASRGFSIVEFNVSGGEGFITGLAPAAFDELAPFILESRLAVNVHVDLNAVFRDAALSGEGYERLLRRVLSLFRNWSETVPVRNLTFDALYASPFPALRRMMGRLLPAALRADQTVLALQQAVELFAGTATVTGLENYGRGTTAFGDLEKIARRVEGEWGLLLDLGHLHLAAERGLLAGLSEGDYIRGLPLPVVNVHVSDNDGKRDCHLLPGRGTIDLEGMAAALRSTGYDGSVVLESAPAARERLDGELDEGLAFLRSRFSVGGR